MRQTGRSSMGAAVAGGGTVADGVIQVEGGVPLSAALTNLTDQLGYKTLLFASDTALHIGTTTASGMRFDGSGNITGYAAQTWTLGGDLTLYNPSGSVTNSFVLDSLDDVVSKSILFKAGGLARWGINANFTSFDLNVYSNGGALSGTYISVGRNSGNVGVGVTPTLGKVHILGTSGSNTLYVSNSGGTGINTISTTGAWTSTFTGQTAGQVFGGVSLLNNTAAALGAQQFSPASIWSGYGWSSTASTSNLLSFRSYVKPIQGTTVATIAGGLTFETWNPTNSTWYEVLTLGHANGGANSPGVKLRSHGSAIAEFIGSTTAVRATMGDTGTFSGSWHTVESSWNIGGYIGQNITGGSTVNATPTITGATVTGLYLQNTNAATSGNQRWSPPITLEGRGWGTTGSASQVASAKLEFVPVQAGTVSGKFQISIYDNATPAYATVFSINQNGTAILPTYGSIGTTAMSLNFGNGLMFTNGAPFGINTGTTVSQSAMFEVRETTKGALLPRMTTTQRNAITNSTISIVSISGNGTTVTYNCLGTVSFYVGQTITITGATSTAYNLINAVVASVSGASFTVTDAATGATSTAAGTYIPIGLLVFDLDLQLLFVRRSLDWLAL
jgi:hypothetical protein